MRPNFFSVICGLPLACCVSSAAARADDELPKPIELTISGQAIEQPVLKYRLLPTEPELPPGNAATILLRLPWDETKYFAEVVPTYDKWSATPLDDPEWEKSKGVLPSDFYFAMKRAAFRRHADWEYPIDEAVRVSILLPDIQGARDVVFPGLVGKALPLARGMSSKTRANPLLVGLALARHYAATPFPVCKLVACAEAKAILSCVGEMIGLADSPNLYWALGALPRPMFDLRPMAEMDEDEYRADVEGLANLDRIRTVAEWQAISDEVLQVIKYQARTVDKNRLLEYAKKTRPEWSHGLPEGRGQMCDDEIMVRRLSLAAQATIRNGQCPGQSPRAKQFRPCDSSIASSSRFTQASALTPPRTITSAGANWANMS